MDEREAWPVATEAELLACYDATSAEVYRYTVRLTGRPAAAEDVVQETYLRLVRSRRPVRRRDGASTQPRRGGWDVPGRGARCVHRCTGRVLERMYRTVDVRPATAHR